ncbi:MAG TPA: isoprenylcysteine carboxylmethyltransferase family protein [Acidimicrobiales bacterium]|nr:isoprenylcysteine carboxylmethyltransferase family protein [Acidimicrobiales bacterium]
MRRSAAVAGSSLFFAAAPGLVAGVVPWLLTGWQGAEPPWPAPVRVVGAALVAAGTVVLVHAFARFVREGRGTPAPVGPTERLVVGGLYRHVRNPMYVAVASAIVGQALLLGRPVLLAWAALAGAAMVAFVRVYEEPLLAARYGDEYRTYCRHVPGWLPRLRPWIPDPRA